MNLHKTIKLVGGFLAFVAALMIALLSPTGTASAEFTGCRDSGDPTNNGSIVINAGAIGPHNLDPNIDPPYTPIAGDEIAVFNTNGDCAGKVTHTPASNNGLTVWGGVDGMAPGEAMEFRIWDSANDRFFVMNVTITPNSNYLAGQLYFLTSGTPTAVTLQSLTAVTAIPTPFLLIALLLVAAVALLTAVALRRRIA